MQHVRPTTASIPAQAQCSIWVLFSASKDLEDIDRVVNQLSNLLFHIENIKISL